MAYDKGWAAVNRLIRAGRSFSGRERNCCFLNTGGPRFATVSAALDLHLPDDSRGLALTDWDGDGRIDFWLTNRTGPRVRFLKNEYDSNHHYVALQLTGTKSNRDAIGARVELYVGGQTVPLLKSVYGGSGYISQSSKVVHFGLGSQSQVDRIVVRWPGDQEETFAGPLPVDRRYQLIQGTGRAEAVQVARTGPWASHAATEPALPRTDRVVLLQPAPLPDQLQLRSLDGHTRPLLADAAKGKRGTVINLWATWCTNCLAELEKWQRDQKLLEDAGLHVLTVCVDQPEDGEELNQEAIRTVAQQLQIPFELAIGDARFVEILNVVQRAFIGRQTDLPLPSSFLIDEKGQLSVIYKGPVEAAQLVADSKLLGQSRDAIFDGAIPFGGQWLERPPVTSPRMVAVALVEHGYLDAAESYARQLLDRPTSPRELSDDDRLSLHHLLGAVLFDRQAYEEARAEYLDALKLSPNHRDIRQELARTCLRLERYEEAADQLSHLLEMHPENAEWWSELGRVRIRQKQPNEAARCFEKSLQLQPRPDVHFEWANALRDSRQFSAARDAYRKLLEELPSPIVMNNLAWLLATAADDQVRDATLAIELAQRATEVTQRSSPRILGTLAAAYAEGRQFDQAVRVLDEAILLAQEKEPSILNDLKDRRNDYAAQKPTRD